MKDLDEGRLIDRTPRALVKTGIKSRQTLWRRSRDPDDDFPAPVDLGGRLIGWYSDEMDHWIATRPRVSYAKGKEGEDNARATG